MNKKGLLILAAAIVGLAIGWYWGKQNATPPLSSTTSGSGSSTTGNTAGTTGAPKV